MTASYKLAAGDKVLVKIGKNAIKAEVLEVLPDGARLRSLTTGKEFKSTRVMEVLESAQHANDGIENATFTAEQLRQQDEVAEHIAAIIAPQVVEQVKANPELAQVVRDIAEPAEAPEQEETEHDEQAEAPEQEDAKPAKKLSLLEAAYSVMLLEKRPMNTREMVKLATEKGLWTPTACKTPEQSLYGAIFLEMKNRKAPRFKKSEKRGAFELA